MTNIEETEDRAPEILVTPLSINYGTLDIGETASEQVRIENTGDAVLEVADLLLQTVSASSTSPFTLTSSPFPVSLEPGAFIEVPILYTATTPADQGTATVISSDPDEAAIEISLNGGYTGPHLEIRPPAIDFGDRMLNCEETRIIELHSVGTETLEMYDVFLEEENYEIVSFEGEMALDPGQLALVEVRFNPDAPELYTDLLVVNSNDMDEATKTGALFGTGDDDGSCSSLDLSFKVEYEIADIATIIDVTGSMFNTITGLQTEFSGIAQELFNEIEDITFGVGEFRDYNYARMGSGADKPFELLVQQTTDLPRVQKAFDGMSALNGGDSPESSLEALYQALTGQGYDQNCNEEYDDDDDVAPFKRRSTDAFGGNVGGSQSGAVPGGGSVGGMGFREDVLSIIIFATDNFLRDPDNGYPAPGGCTTAGMPGSDAGSEMVKEAAADINARIIGVGVNFNVGSSPYKQMDEVSDLVVTWGNNVDDFQETIVGAVLELISDETFNEVELVVSKDDYNLVDSVTPDQWTAVPSGTEVTFTITTVEGSAIVLDPEEGITTDIVVDVYGSIESRSWLLNSHTFHALIPEDLRDSAE
ncbi:MAG: choice-of-anchor D domain-containing protein [Myxococcota bacterium]